MWSMNKNQDLFPIGVLAATTGINPMTLRSWERRYGLLKPTRTNKGHRLYNATDVELVKRITAYIKRGVSVGKVKVLMQLANQEAIPEEQFSNWADYINKVFEAARNFNINKLEGIYNEIISLYPVEVISTRLFLPLLKTYQARILANYQGALAEEHFLANYIRNRLAAHFQQLASVSQGSELIFAALPGERHDFVLLLFAIHCMNAGLNILSLGTNTPMDQILFAAQKKQAASIVCFGQLSKGEEHLAKKSDSYIFNYSHPHNLSPAVISLDEDFSKALHTIRNTMKRT